jgi:ADP-heptose:LPS heptosyltransferase
MKVLAIQFRYLGDAVLLTPALRAIKERFPDASLHVLVAEEVAPLLRHLPWVERVWAFPRRRGKANVKQTLPLIGALRRERFDCSIDFWGNDRGAILSRFCGARERLGALQGSGFPARRFCYTEMVPLVHGEHQCRSNFRLLARWGIGVPEQTEMEIRADPALVESAAQLLPRAAILGHVATSQPKKDWPIAHWAEFHRLALAGGHEIAFSSGFAPRERALLDELKKRVPAAATLPAMPDLSLFLAVIKRARVFVSGCTGPLHFAAGLGVPTVGLFGPTSPGLWAPLGPRHQFEQGAKCSCSGNVGDCSSANPCMASITPEAVFRRVSQALASGAEAPGKGVLA